MFQVSGARHVTGGRPGISLSELFPAARLLGSEKLRVQACCSDWEQVQPGDLFVAIETPARDGHQDIAAAVSRGAVAVLAERLAPVDIPQCLVEDSRVAFAELCQALAGNPSQQLRLIGITGSHGKTLTAHWLHSILNAAGHPSGLLSSVETFDGQSRSSSTLSNATPPLIALQLAQMSAEGLETAIVELPSQALAQRHWAGISLDAAVLTNLRQEHLDFHGNAANSHQAMLRACEQLEDGGLLIYDADDQASEQALDQAPWPALSISLNDAGEINAYLIERCLSEQTFLLTAGDESIVIRIPLIGDAALRCALLAAAAALGLGIDLATIARGLEQAGAIPGRLERIECGQEFGVFVDVARAPEQVREVLRTLRQVTRGRLTCVLGAKASRPANERPVLGRLAERYADRAILTADNPEFETVLEIAHDLLDGFDAPGDAHIIPDRGDAIRYALETSQPGDTVVVLGKGDEDFQDLAGSRWACDDRIICREHLYRIANDSPAFPGRPTNDEDGDAGPTIYRIDDYR